jgi:RNA polymerase sigma factor (TIGR02999 family)
MNDVTHILGEIEAGQSGAAERLLPLIYNELRKLAGQKMSAERKDHTLQGTALVHEAYVRLVGSGGDDGWRNRAHFFGAAAEAMRRILVEQARRKNGAKAGGNHQRVELSCAEPLFDGPDGNLLDLNDALDRLEAHDARAAEIVKLRFFAGLTREETARSLDISTTTADDDWTYAKNWLRVHLSN